MNRSAGNKRPGTPRWTCWAVRRRGTGRPGAGPFILTGRPHWGDRQPQAEEGGVTDAADGGRRDSAAVGTASPPARVPATVLAEHQAAVAAISEAYAALPPGSPVRLAKRTSNLFRFRDPPPGGTPGDGTTARGGAGARDRGAPGDGTAAGNGMAAAARGLRAAGSRGRAPSSGTGGLGGLA